ncbi:MAG: NADPH-dependent 7-cyano-7-deazaguanine reductase QueF [Chromatiales bacterium]|nr:NADPH-dependent 7-cyano-7-deazaguanine reductase QueF [Chromatiales bacterium]
MPNRNPSKNIETFDNPRIDRDYTIDIDIPEFTCLCPLTGQPDFAHLYLHYKPDKLCIELKSLKNYMWSFRNKQAFHEAISNEILDHLCRAIEPRFMQLTADFNIRGGIQTSVTVEHYQDGYFADDTDLP